MHITVKKWGNSAAVRIPTKILNAAHLDIEQQVDIRVEGGKIVIDPVGENDLDTLLSQITPDNVHNEVDFGAPVGKELL